MNSAKNLQKIMNSVTIQNESSGSKSEFDKLYEFGTEIGKGRYASVKKCYCKKTRNCYAAKVIKNFRTKNAKLNLNIVDNEITALTISRPHPAIVNLYEVFYNRGETILILEYATEKDLHIYLDNEGAFAEEQACKIIYQVLKAIEFLHSKQVLHLDIKPENVLLMNPLEPKCNLTGSLKDIENKSNNEIITEVGMANSTADIRVKLCDFSFSQIMVPGKPILGMMGTVAYSAPEVLQYDALTKATDMWSLGVLAHVILTEYTPFGNGTEELNQTQTNILNIRDKDFECVEDYFDNISYEAKDFIENLIKFKPKQRLTIEQALNHCWFKKYSIDKTSKEFDASPLITSKIDIAEEDNKENLTQENNLIKNQNSNMKLLTAYKNSTEKSYSHNLTMNKMGKLDTKLANENGAKIMDDKNNNNLAAYNESNSNQNSDSAIQAVKKSNSVLDTMSSEKKTLESANTFA